MEIGSARWNEISQKLSVLRGAHQVEGKQLAQILHYVTPNGCDLRQQTACMQDETGQWITGQQALARLTGAETVYTVETGVGGLSTLVKLHHLHHVQDQQEFPHLQGSQRGGGQV